MITWTSGLKSCHGLIFPFSKFCTTSIFESQLHFWYCRIYRKNDQLESLLTVCFFYFKWQSFFFSFISNDNPEEPYMVRKIATRYCKIYNNPSNEYIIKNINNNLQEKRCEIILIDIPNDDHEKKTTMPQSTIYTIAFASIGFVFFAFAVGMVVFVCRRYRGMTII